MTYEKIPPGAKSHKTYVVPAYQIRREIERSIPQLQAEYERANATINNYNSAVDKNGWRDYLSSRVSSITGRSIETSNRHLYRVMNNESKVCVAEMADAYMLACGKLIDRDTNIQTLPGSFKNAKEMVQLRKKGLSKEEIEAKARRLIEYQFRLVFKDGYEVSPITVGYREKRQANQARKKTERRARAEAELDSLRTVKAA